MHFLRYTFGVFILLIQITCAHADVIQAGELTFQANQEKAISIYSDTLELEILAKKAFSIHGAFRLSQPEHSEYSLKLIKISDNQIDFTLSNKHTLLASRSLEGNGWQDATLKTCDWVVQKILNIPGFFSGQFAFVGDRGNGKEIYIGDIFFQIVKQITHDRSDPIMPRLSKNGQKMLYTTYFKNGFPDIYCIDLMTKQRIPIATYQGINTGGSFSPNSERIVMVLSSSGTPQVYISNYKGKNPKRLTHNKSLKASPSFSPDGGTIVYVSDELGSPQLYEISSQGGPAKRLQTHISKYCAEPEYNPLNKQQVIFTGAVSKTFQIALYDAEKGTRFITQGNQDHIEPCWLEDGRHIVCTERKKSVKKLCIIDTWSGKKSIITPSDFGNMSMAFFIH